MKKTKDDKRMVVSGFKFHMVSLTLIFELAFKKLLNESENYFELYKLTLSVLSYYSVLYNT